MKITRVSVGSVLAGADFGGFTFSVSGSLGVGEEFAASDASALGNAIASAIAAFTESATADPAPSEASTPTTSRRSRTAATAEPQSITSGFSNGDEVAISGVVGMTELNGRRFFVQNVTEPAPSTGRRRRGTTEAAPVEEQENPTEPSVGGRRRRGAASAEAVTENAVSGPPPARRRRSASAESEAKPNAASSASSPSDDKVSDADMTKACSEAARETTPKVPMTVLAQFGVSRVDEVPQAKRRQFLEKLEKAVKRELGE